MEDIASKKVMIAVPAMDSVPTHFAISLYNLRKPCMTRLEVVSNSLVYDSRNLLAAKAIDDDCDYVLWIDSDMVFNADLLEKLLEKIEGKDFISVLAFTRHLPVSPNAYVIDASKESLRYKPIKNYPKNQLFKVDAAGFGTVLTSTKILKAVFDKYERPFNPDMGLGEDLTFCYRARQLGFDLWCDSSVKIGHVGRYVYGENDYNTTPERE